MKLVRNNNNDIKNNNNNRKQKRRGQERKGLNRSTRGCKGAGF